MVLASSTARDIAAYWPLYAIALWYLLIAVFLRMGGYKFVICETDTSSEKRGIVALIWVLSPLVISIIPFIAIGWLLAQILSIIGIVLVPNNKE